MNKQLEYIYRCPKCQENLDHENSLLVCRLCSQSYPPRDNIYDLMPDSSDRFKDIEERFWDLTYEQEGARTLENRNSYFHEHFRAELTKLPPASIILELGCGTRLDGIEAIADQKFLIATDISIKALKHAKKLASGHPASDAVTYIRADAGNIPIRNGSVDGILMAASYHHVEHPDATAKEMARVLRPGGVLVLGVEPNRWPYLTIYPLLSPVKKVIRKKRKRQLDSIADDTTRGFTKKSFRRLLEPAGFEIEEIKPVKFTLEWHDSFQRFKQLLLKREAPASQRVIDRLSRVDQALEKIPIINTLAWHWNVIARKK